MCFTGLGLKATQGGRGESLARGRHGTVASGTLASCPPPVSHQKGTSTLTTCECQEPLQSGSDAGTKETLERREVCHIVRGLRHKHTLIRDVINLYIS